MPYIRIVHPLRYDIQKERFQSTAFQPSTNNGISVFDEECGIKCSGSVCQHIRKYYSQVHGEPIIYTIVPNDFFEADKVNKTPSNTGDDCHADIMAKTKKASRDLVKKLKHEAYAVCLENDVTIPLTKEIAIESRKHHENILAAKK